MKETSEPPSTLSPLVTFSQPNGFCIAAANEPFSPTTLKVTVYLGTAASNSTFSIAISESVYPDLTATALIVLVTASVVSGSTTNGTVYFSDDVVGKLPSLV